MRNILQMQKLDQRKIIMEFMFSQQIWSHSFRSTDVSFTWNTVQYRVADNL